MNYSSVPAVTSNNFSTIMLDYYAAPEVLCEACVCPCYVVGKNAEKLDPSLSANSVCITDCLIGTFIPCYICCYRAKYRKKLRQRYSIVGNDLRDCCMYTPCIGFPVMALVQESRELELREDKPGQVKDFEMSHK